MSYPGYILAICLRGQADVMSSLGTHELGGGEWVLVPRQGSPPVPTARTTRLTAMTLAAGFAVPGIGALFPARGNLPLPVHERLACRRSDIQSDEMAFVLQELLWPALSVIGRCPGRTLSKRRHLFCRLQATRMFLAGHLESPPKLSEVAALVNISECYLVRIYAQVYGLPPLQDHFKMRMDHAKRLLAGGVLSVGEIAMRCGYGAASNFSRAFGNTQGTSPTAWRVQRLKTS